MVLRMPVKPSVTPGRTESVGKAIRLLALFRGVETPVRIAEASAATGLARSTTHRLLATLQAAGFVRQEPATRAYYPGPALLDLARSLSRDIEHHSTTTALAWVNSRSIWRPKSLPETSQ